MFTSRSTANPGVYLGTVTRVDDDGAYVEVPRLNPGYEYGPARYPLGDFGFIAAGDDVAVVFLEGGRDELVVMVRLA